MPQSGDFFKTVAKRTVKDRELERIIATITNMNTFTRNVRNQAARKIQKAWKSGKRREARQLVRNLQAGIVDNLANELKKLNLTNKNNNGNVIMANAPPLPKKKRKSANSNSNSNNNQARGYRKRQVNLPNINIGGGGMGCGYAGIPRYMQRAQERFDNASVVSAFLEYTIATNRYGILKNISKILNRRGVVNNSSRISVGKQVHFFMVGIRDVDKAHAVSVLVDPAVYTGEFRMWVFDPHGQASRSTIWGTTMRQKVVPIIKDLWGTNFTVRYYNGPNLQADDNRGVCTTFYVTFMDYIRALIAGENINGITRFAAQNSTNRRKYFLNFPPEIKSLVVSKNKTK
tara:strand:- start:6185 stop:7219 length:1035 start_codon:yes stop_codon:yes gene_type:complete